MAAKGLIVLADALEEVDSVAFGRLHDGEQVAVSPKDQLVFSLEDNNSPELFSTFAILEWNLRLLHYSLAQKLRIPQTAEVPRSPFRERPTQKFMDTTLDFCEDVSL